MLTTADDGRPGPHRARLISAAGVAIICLGGGAALLPVVGSVKGPLVIGALLATAGLIESLAGLLRRDTRPLAFAAGFVTLLAGLIFIAKPANGFFPNVVLVIAWLVVRSVTLAIASRRAGGSVRRWTVFSAAMDFALAMVLGAGLSIATIIVSLFGPTQPLIASFAWVLAASFVVNGLLLLEVASCERSPA